jgi:hypothetical protein
VVLGAAIRAGAGQGDDRVLENDQSRSASREANCPLLQEVRRVIRLVMSAHVPPPCPPSPPDRGIASHPRSHLKTNVLPLPFGTGGSDH